MDKVIIDVREPNEFAQSHVSGAINVPLSQLSNNPKDMESIPHDAQIVVYCRSGGRSSMAMEILKQKGYSNVVNGINEDQVTREHL